MPSLPDFIIERPMRVLQANILQIAYKFPPIKSIGALRNYHIARQFRRRFHSHFVITTRNRDFMLGQPLPESEVFDLYPVRTFDFRTLLHRWGRRSGHFAGQPGGLTFRDRLKDSFPTNLLLDEGSLVYIAQAYRQGAQLVEAHGITHLFSSYRPYADHLVAWLLKGRFPQLYWIADFRDPQVDLNRGNVYWPALQHAFNRRILRRADQVVTVSQGLARYLERYGQPVAVLRNGIDPALFPAEVSAPSEHFTIAYTGSIYPGWQSALPVLEMLAGMIREGLLDAPRLRLRYVGKDQALWDAWAARCGLDGINQSSGLVGLEESLAIQRSSQINLLLSWSGPHFQGILTGKLYEYLAAQRPILALVQGGCDAELAGILQSVGASFAFFTESPDWAGLRRFILERYAAWQRGAPSSAFDPSALRAFTWEAMMDEFLEGLDA
jgi:glycosyltransferase involved in cell wall biosynthesis